MRRLIQKIRFEEKASVMVITGLLLAILIGFLGLAVDSSYAFYVRTKMQSAADSAALGAAADLANGGSTSNAILVARSLATSNGFTSGTADAVVTPSIPPGPNPNGSTPSYFNNSNYVRVRINQNIPLFFAPVIGVASSWPVQVNAVAGIKSAPDCLVTRAGFQINGTNIASLNNCSAAIGGSLQATNQSKITITGSGTIDVYNNGAINCPSCSPTPTPKSSAFPSLPSLSIPSGLAVVADSTCANRYCQPGIYNSKLTLNKGASYTFASGFYVFNKGLVTNSAIVQSETNGVTFYVASNQPIDLSGNLTLTAKIPANCTPGSAILIYQEPSSIFAMNLAGSNDRLNLTGIVSLPYTDIRVSGSSSNLSLNGSIIANSLVLNGNMNPSASANECNNFVSNTRVVLFE
ncbi:pilus assembly protein TadG-related protein [Polynucleobacter sp. HIN8]|uniref:pilus assembly protein TadG-related protein n=1 Tax=Polynucleobacter sp. HIN8 TaxID=3047867 RepID=UPI0025743EC7|nr:pilus assembly protein TadG-related protein [Polynucleobacter sp. HIN8]